MGVDLHDVGYLHYCAERGLGEADMKKIEVLDADKQLYQAVQAPPQCEGAVQMIMRLALATD